MNTSHYVKSAGIVGLSTFASRLLGLIRDMALAAVFGASWVLDAFLLAFTVPNLFRQFFGEGAVSSAFLPVFTEVNQKQGKEKAWQLASNTMTLLCLVLFILTIIGMLLCWGLVSIPGLSEKNQLALELTILLMPYLMFICIAAFLGAILNSLQHFLTPALSPIVLNIFWIAGIYWVSPCFGHEQIHWAYGMSIAILVSGIFQIILQYPALKICNAQLRPSWQFHDVAMSKIFLRLGPIILGAAAVQINVVADRLVAWFMIPGDGGLTILYMANRLMQFPLAIIGISIATVAFPLFSHFVATDSWIEFKKAVPKALQISFLIAVPASIGLILLSPPIIRLIYQRAQFDSSAALRTGYVLMAYSSGLWLFVLMQIILRGFYALGDTKTPMYVSLAAVVNNLVWNIILVRYWHETGLAISTSVNALLQVSILLYFLQRKIPLDWTGTKSVIIKCIIATTIMAASVLGCLYIIQLYSENISISLKRFLIVFGPIFVGISIYFAIGKILNISEFNYILQKMQKKILKK